MKINNKALTNFLMYKLDKNNDDFTDDELAKIDELVIDYADIDEDEPVNFNILNKFKNLKELTIMNYYLNNKFFITIFSLQKLSSLTFDSCEFENATIISTSRLKELTIYNCNINDYTFIYHMNDLESLTITNGKNIDLTNIHRLNKLKYLNISNCSIINETSLLFPSLNELYIEKTPISFNNIITLPNLKLLGITKNQFTNEELNLLNNVKIIYDGIGSEDNV